MEGQGHGTSLWLMPDGPSSERLISLVSALASRLGTPVFVPHVTLLHGLAREESELLARTEALSKQLAEKRVALGPLDSRDEYFRCLYFRAKPEEWFLAAHARAAQAFDLSPDPEYLPHLSLVYGRLGGAEKERIASSLAAELPISVELTAVEVWRTVGPVGDWTRRRRFTLAAPSFE
jgi:Cyclic phosphodiesterase-like protein